jgi:NADH-quinone oxidoreductase subunit N
MRDLCVPLTLIAGAFLILGVDVLLKKVKPIVLEALSYVTVLAAFVALFLRVDNPSAVAVFNGAVRFDGFSIVMILSILAATGLALLQSSHLAQRSNILFAEFLALVLLAASGMCFLIMSNDLITLFLSLEIMSLAVYVLTGVTRNEPRSTEASIKYFIVGSVASAFLVYGMVLVFGVTNSIQLPEIGERISSGGVGLIGIGMMMIGFAFKVGAVPFHMWVPDVYEGAPTAVTSFMSVAVKAAGFATLLRVVASIKTPLPGETADILQWIAILTMVVGNLMAIAQPSVKRMLAYSSIAHSGYALIGVIVTASSTVASERLDGSSATAFYLLIYTFMTLGGFAMISFAGEKLDDFQGLGYRRPLAALAMTVFMLSLAGVPPLGGFFGKFYLFRVALDSGLTGLVMVAVVTTLISVYYYVRVIVVMFMKPSPENASSAPGSFEVGLAVAVAALFTVALGLVPNDFIRLVTSLRLPIPG